MKIALGLLLMGLAIVIAFAGDPDDDGDGVPNDEDCRPNDPNLWGAPAAGVTDLTLGRPTATLTWSRPPDLGCVPGFERYDALASVDVTNFGYPLGFCAEINTSDLSATDERLLEPGAAAFYLVRVENECGLGPLDSAPPPVTRRVADYLEVTNLNDDGPGSLRAAIAAAAGGEAICFEPTGTLALTSGPVSVDENVAIAGPGASLLTIDGGGGSSVLSIVAPEAASISDLTVTGGAVGIGLYYVSVARPDAVPGNDAGPGIGRAVLQSVIKATTIQGNDVGIGISDTHAPVITTTTIQGNDVGIFMDGYYTYPNVISSTIRDNRIGIAAYGYYSGVVVKSSTIAGNDVGFRDLVFGGNFNFVLHSTVADNEVGLQLENDVFLSNSILANAIDCDDYPGHVISGTNLIVDPDCGAPGDIHADPRLGPLGSHGGPTATFPLLTGSPAIDAGGCAGHPFFGAEADQRGFPRPIDHPELPNAFDGCDLGAYEVQSEFACDCQSTEDCDFPDSCYAGCVCRYQPFCGSGICDPGEDGVSCPEDCPAVCGNGVVEPGEECEVAQDCGSCPGGRVPVCTDCECGCVPP